MPGPGHEEGHLSKRKQAHREERRRQSVEINLLVEKDEQKAQRKARRGCTLPFLGAGLLLLTFEAVRFALV